VGAGRLASSSSRAHGRRDTNAYPAAPNTTGIIINIPNTVLIIDFSIPLCPLLSGAGSWLSYCGRGDPEINDYVGSAGTTVTIAQRLIFRAGSV
jgi:hypothetical protein